MSDAALDHASMAEALLRQAARAQEQIEYNRERIDALRSRLDPEQLNENADYDDYLRKLHEARDDFDYAISTAQVHATLACAPRQLMISDDLGEALDITANESITLVAAGDVRVGSRVVWVQPRPGRRGGEMLVLATDVLGTVESIKLTDGEFPVAHITWDDGLTSTDTSNVPVLVRELRVVLDA